MTTFLTAVANIAALLWLAGGIYVIWSIHSFNKRCDKVIKEFEADIERNRRELEKWQ